MKVEQKPLWKFTFSLGLLFGFLAGGDSLEGVQHPFWTKGATALQERAEANTCPLGGQIDGTTNSLQVDELERAFRTALGALRGNVALANPGGRILIKWQNPDTWLVQIQKYPDVPHEGLSILVKTNGTVALKWAKSGASASAWVAAGKGGKAGTNGKLRPEVAFRKGIQSFGQYGQSINLHDVRGCITLSRSVSDDGWFMDISRFGNMHLGGTWIRVKDDGTLESMGGL